MSQPSLHSWTDEPLRLVAQTVAKDDPDPKALAAYGLLCEMRGDAENAAKYRKLAAEMAGKWVQAAREDEGFGIHACRPRDLSWWINAELWRVELEGPVRERATRVFK